MTSSEALERLLDLVADPPADPDLSAGWLDLLDEPQGPPSLARRLMESTAVPVIYTDYWRPALGRIAKGLRGPSMQEEQRLAEQWLDLHDGDVVLDVGCGPGNFTQRFADLVGPKGLAVGLDTSVTMLRRAASNAGQGSLAYLRADAVRPPLRYETFDAVCCFAALHMFDEPGVALASFARILRPGGRLALLTSVRRAGSLGLADSILGRASGMHMFGRTEVVQWLDELGFADIEHRVTGVAQFIGGRLA